MLLTNHHQYRRLRRRRRIGRLCVGAFLPALFLLQILLVLLLIRPAILSVVDASKRRPPPNRLSQRKQQQQQRRKQRSAAKHQPEFYIINLDRDKERWDSVVSELTSKGVSPKRIKRIPAVFGKNLTVEDLETNTTFVARHFSTPGTIGCFLSHRNFWKQTAEGDEPYRLCFEDDVLVAQDFPEKVAEVLREIDVDCPLTKEGNWDVIFLGSLGCVHPRGKYGLNRIAAYMSGGLRTPQRVLEGAPHCHLPRRPLGAHAYILSKRGASKLLSGCSKVSGHVDVVAWGMPSLKVVAVHPMLAHQNMGSVSTIGAITNGPETLLPRVVLDEYTGIVLEWVYNAPVLKLGPVLLTMGRSVVYILGGYLVAALLYDKHPWLMVFHTIVFGILFVLTKATTVRCGKQYS